MKKILFSLSLHFVMQLSFAQNNVGIGTGTPNGKLHVVGSNDTSQLVIDANATQTNTPLIRLRNASGQDLLHIHSNDSTNSFFGVNAGRKTKATATFNTFLGAGVGKLNTDGSGNTGVGTYALSKNATGTDNTAVGGDALMLNGNGSQNTALGAISLFNNTSGSHNTAVGESALFGNQTGFNNTAVGYYALVSATNGYNTAIGSNALINATIGQDNIAIGEYSLDNITTGSFNIGIGCTHGACSGFGNISNSIIIGNQSLLCTQNSNYALFGSTNTTWTGGNTMWSTYSDARIKTNVKEDVVGLPFIMKLRPVTYNRSTQALMKTTGREDKTTDYPEKYDIDKITFSGFLAQEVEKAANDVGYNFHGVTKPKTNTDLYSLSYESFVVPMIKAMQEQQVIIQQQQKDIDLLKQQVAELLQKQKQ